MTPPRGRPFQRGFDQRRAVGRSPGRQTAAFKAQLERVRDEAGLAAIEAVLSRQVLYDLHGVCSECGKESTGRPIAEIVKLLPTPVDVLRAAEIVMRFTLPKEVVVTLAGFEGAAQAFETIKHRITVTLPPDAAEKLIADIDADLAALGSGR